MDYPGIDPCHFGSDGGGEHGRIEAARSDGDLGAGGGGEASRGPVCRPRSRHLSGHREQPAQPTPGYPPMRTDVNELFPSQDSFCTEWAWCCCARHQDTPAILTTASDLSADAGRSRFFCSDRIIQQLAGDVNKLGLPVLGVILACAKGIGLSRLAVATIPRLLDSPGFLSVQPTTAILPGHDAISAQVDSHTLVSAHLSMEQAVHRFGLTLP